MTNRCGEDVCRPEETRSRFAPLLHPVARDLHAMQQRLAAVLADTRHPSVREIVDFLLAAPGKRIRPALVLLSARVATGPSNGSSPLGHSAVDVAAAVEIIHMASLIHDDLVDDAALRHHRPTVHVRWSKRAAVRVGGYLCAKAFRLIAHCADPRLFTLLGSQLCTMCEGEIQQVAGRGDVRFSESYCLAMAEKKTAALFRACCGAGAVTARSTPQACRALQAFGHHYGVAFQILDDCRDLLSDAAGLGKAPGQDLLAGDMTLPLWYTLGCDDPREPGLAPVDRYPAGDLDGMGAVFHSSSAPARVAALLHSHVDQAKQALEPVADSDFRKSLHGLADDLAVCASRLLAE
ncbi:MAG: polyprenyl synthetase family protein [Planctomycetes bacterium]|nr:polyprenyl synthetase family protein [Planctomycetota bacterium]